MLCKDTANHFPAAGQANIINAREVKSMQNGVNKNQKNHTQQTQPGTQKDKHGEKTTHK